MRPAQPPSVQGTAPASIAPVPVAARAAVRSQAVISTVAEALAEVVANALDAGATEVNIDMALAPESLGFRVQDNGRGVPAASMALLGQRFATSKGPRLGATAAAAAASAAPYPLGYRGEALAAIREAAGALEVTSRAAGSFETLSIALQPGGRVAGPALATEQRVRQGTVVAVRNLFATQPVRRKALLSRGLQHEADRCREVVLCMALLRPSVTFTLFDRGRRAFVLRLVKGRSELEGVTEFLGRLPQLVAALQPAPAAAFVVSGYAALPPYGQPSTNRQCIYINGRWVKAPPVARLVDSVFQQCYKPNMRLLEGQGEELQAVRKASNKHAAFVLHISCCPSEYELAHEAEGYLVQFRSWEPLLAAVKHSLLAAWRLALSNSLLKQLEQLEGGGAAGGAAAEGAAPAVPAAGSMQPSHQPSSVLLGDWLQDQRGQDSFDAVQARAADGVAARAPATAAAERAAGPPSGSSGRQRGWSGAQKLSGAKHTLASRLVRYNGATALPLGGSGSSGVAGASSGPLLGAQPQQQVHRGEIWEGSDAWLTSRTIGVQQQQQQQQQQVVMCQLEAAQQQHQEHQHCEGWWSPRAAFARGEEAPEASCQVQASHFPQQRIKQQRREQVLQPLPMQGPSRAQMWLQADTAAEQAPPAAAWGSAGWPELLSSAAEDQDQVAIGDEAEQHADPELQQLLAGLPSHSSRAVQQLQFSGVHSYGLEMEMDGQSNGWQQEQQPALDFERWGYEPQEQEQQGRQQGWVYVYEGASGSLRLRLGSSEAVEALIGSWGPPAPDDALSLPDAWTAERCGQPLEQQHGRGLCNRLTTEERVLLQHVAYNIRRCSSRQRSQSAPPHHRPRQRIEVVRRPQRILPLAELAPSQAVARHMQGIATATVAAAAPEVPAPGQASEHPQAHQQDTAIHQRSSGRGERPYKGKEPAFPSLGGTAMQQLPATARQQPSVAMPPAVQPAAVPDFLRPDAGLDELLATWRRPGAPAQPSRRSGPEGILSLDALSAAAFARLQPAALSREQLGKARALQQVDHKFVPIVCGSLLALVDQHAADERVQLERLRDELLGPDGQPQAASSHALRTPMPLDLTDGEQQLLEAYQHKAEAWGWRWVAPAQRQGRSSGFGRQAAPVLTHVPLLWGATLSAVDLKLYLHHLHDTCGAGGLPAGVVRVLNSKACRGAIMFGDALHQGQCQALLDKLAATQLCFSCAHGRPTTVPVVDLQLLQQALRLQDEARVAAAGGGGSSAATAATGQEPGLAGLKARLQALVQ